MDNNNLTKNDINELICIMKNLFLEDKIPWVVGYSGGKDSTASLQLVWYMLSGLSDEEKKHKKVFVICTDTLVESPIVASWFNNSLDKMKFYANENNLPIEVHSLRPEVENSFWVNLIGRGYPTPKNNFRWCTDRLKIKPSNSFIRNVIANSGEAILILGTRKAESKEREKRMKNFEKNKIRDVLVPNSTMQNSFIFSPISEWSNDNVWQYLMQYENPWKHSNKELLVLYKGATSDGECPLVLTTDTPSCGKSRFGCWVCTIVEKDKSMSAMIQNNEENSWLIPLLEFRDELANANLDRDRRDFRRMTGNLSIYNDKLVHGPYTKETREGWLRRLLEMEVEIKNNAPEEYKDTRLITDDEIKLIRRIWLLEKHQFDDKLPEIYEEVKGEKYPFESELRAGQFGSEEWEILKNVCNELYPDEELLTQLESSLVDLERKYSIISVRKGILNILEEKIKQCYYKNEEDALKFAKVRKDRVESDIDILIDDSLDRGEVI